MSRSLFVLAVAVIGLVASFANAADLIVETGLKRDPFLRAAAITKAATNPLAEVGLQSVPAAPTSYVSATLCTGGSATALLWLGVCTYYDATTYFVLSYSGGVLTNTVYSSSTCTGAATPSVLTTNCNAAFSTANLPIVLGAVSTTYIAPPSTAGTLEVFYSTSACSASGAVTAPLGWVFSPFNSCLSAPSGSYTVQSCSSTGASYTGYASATCTGSGAASSLTISSGTCLANNGNSLQDSYANVVFVLGAGGSIITCQAAAPAPAPSPSSSSSTCFAGSEVVHLESGETKSIADVIVGDSIKVFSTDTKDTLFSEVIAVPHGRNSIITDFQHIVTEHGSDIKLTADHLLPAGACDMSELPLSRSADVILGNCIQTVNGQEIVSSNTVTQGEGVYTVVTEKGDYIIVNNVVASPFAVNHALANAFYAMHRWVYAVAPALVGSAYMNGLLSAANHVAAYFAK